MSEFLQSSLEQVNPIAEAWLASGVSSFSLWSDGTLIKKWGDGISEDQETITAPMKYGELRITGRDINSALGRLSIDAKIVTVILNQENNRKLLCEELVNTRDQLVILSSISEITRKIIDPEELLSVLAAEAHRLVNTEEIFFLINIEGQIPIHVFYPRQSLDSEYLVETSKSIKSKLQPNHLSMHHYENGDGKNRDILFIPIRVYKSEIAYMGCINNHDHELTSYDLKFARAIADYAGKEIEKANLMRANIEMARIDTEISLAQKIQKSLLLKELPKVEGLDTFLLFQPASRISGDYYDLVIKPNGLIDFIIGDISGKGMPAALLMAMTLKVIRSVADMDPSPTPAWIIKRSNEILYKDYNDSVMFSTLFIGQYNLKTREVSYSNAGHSPIIYCPAGGRAEMLRADSVPLGIFKTQDSQIRKIRLAPGDVLVLATDGINETSNQSSRLFGFTQLMILVEMLAHKSAAEICEGILQAVQAYGGVKVQEDDRAMMVIKGV
jgi:phosphoserine phosphatase RsbU/P